MQNNLCEKWGDVSLEEEQKNNLYIISKKYLTKLKPETRSDRETFSVVNDLLYINYRYTLHIISVHVNNADV